MWPCLAGSILLGLGFLLAARATALWQLYLAQGLLIGLLGSAALFSRHWWRIPPYGFTAAGVSRWPSRLAAFTWLE